MSRGPLPLFDGFIGTPFEQRFQGLLQESWRERSWHVIVAEPGSGKTMGICDLRDQACCQAGMIGGRRYPILAVTAPKNDPAFGGVGQSPVERLRAENARALGRTQISAL